MDNLDSRIALITGANRGIGLETAKQLGQCGIDVVITSRDMDKGQHAITQLAAEGVTAHVLQLDVTDADSVMTLKQNVLNEFGRIDILINNAGIFTDARMSALDVEVKVLRSVMETNIYGAYRLCQAFIPIMCEQGYGRVVNVSSGMGQLSDMSGYSPAYRMSKTALNALTRIFADEAHACNVLVNAVCPGWVRTDMGGANADRSVEEGAETIVWLAMLEDDGPTGGFFRDKQPIDW